MSRIWGERDVRSFMIPPPELWISEGLGGCWGDPAQGPCTSGPTPPFKVSLAPHKLPYCPSSSYHGLCFHPKPWPVNSRLVLLCLTSWVPTGPSTPAKSPIKPASPTGNPYPPSSIQVFRPQDQQTCLLPYAKPPSLSVLFLPVPAATTLDKATVI